MSPSTPAALPPKPLPMTRYFTLFPRRPAPSHSLPRERGRIRVGRRAVVGRFVFAALILGLAAISMPASARVPVILGFGDSLTSGFGLPSAQAFPARLEGWLHRHGVEARVINAGVSGDTTAGGLARVDWALADKPDLVILA